MILLYQCLYFEVYNDRLYDLLNNRNIVYCREDSRSKFNIVGIIEYYIDSYQTFLNCLTISKKYRIVGQTHLNNESSRSHAILQFTLKKKG